MATKVGIVMPCINLWDKYTRSALDSVAKAQHEAGMKGLSTQVLVIDNASTDATQEEMRKLTGCEYQRNEEMWGFQRSVNFGVKHFLDDGYDYVLVLNNDIRLHPQAIVRLVERMERGRIHEEASEDFVEHVGMVTCLDATGECERDPERIAGLDDVEKEACPETPNPCFSAFMVSGKCWARVGEFDELFWPAYYEDNDYHYRMKLARVAAITYPPAMFFHWGSATQLEALGRPLTDSSNQHANYVRKWGGDPGKEAYTSPFNNPEIDLSMVTKRS